MQTAENNTLRQIYLQPYKNTKHVFQQLQKNICQYEPFTTDKTQRKSIEMKRR